MVCAHVGPLLRRAAPFPASVGELARRAVVLVRDAPSGDDTFFFPELYPVLKGRPYARGSGAAEMLAAVADLGIAPTVTPIEYRADRPG